jgi:hypothetical protein
VECGVASAGPKLCHCTPVWTLKTPKIWIEVHKVVNRKFVDLTTLYNFYKGRMVFSQQILHKLLPNFNVTQFQWTGAAGT